MKTMNNETKTEFDRKAIEIEQTELETVADALRVRSGLLAGLSPCL